VNIGNKGSNKLMSLFLGLLGVGLGMFMALSFGSNIPWMVSIRDLIINNSLIVIGVGALVLSSLFAYTTGLNRLYTYGFFSFVVFILGYFVSIPFAYFPLTIGLVFMISGIFLLRQFINKYPLTKGAIANEK
jgi:hypothetical protein